jgi:hypothetical protein
VFKPRGAAVRQFAGKARSVYCSKQLQKLHPCHLYREGACGGIRGRTASHTCRVVSSPPVSTPSSWWLEVALMTTVRSGKCSARPRHTLTPLLAPTTQPRPSDSTTQTRNDIVAFPITFPPKRATECALASRIKQRPQLHSAQVIAYTTLDPAQHERLRRLRR